LGVSMSMEKISKYTKFFDLMLIGDEASNQNLYEYTYRYFRTVYRHDFVDLNTKLSSCHLLCITGTFDQIFKAETKTALASISRIDTVIFTDEPENLNLYKEALLIRSSHVGMSVKSEIDLSHILLMILPMMIKKYNESLTALSHKQIAEHSSTLYWIHKNKKSVYANESFKRFFGISAMGDFDTSVAASHLFENGDSRIKMLHDATKMEHHVFTEMIPLNHSETLIQITPLPHHIEREKVNFLNRITFIEVLKDAFIIHRDEYEPIPVVIMIMDNQEKIVDEFGENGYNNTCKEILELTKKHFGSHSQIVLWHKDVFLLMNESETLQKLTESLERLHTNIVSHLYAQSVVPVLKSYVLDLSKLELNKAINVIDNIHSKKLISSDLSSLIYHELFFDEGLHSVKDQAIHYLEKLFLSKSQVKLLNFYKGIRISTIGQMIKIADGLVYMGIEKIQGYAMRLEENIVIQATNLPFDIGAEIKLVDIGKKIAVLHNFEPLRVSANNRQHIRIQSDHRMHVTIKALRHIISASILDISIKSIACRVNNAKNIPPLGSLVSMQFHLPSKRFDDGSVNMLVTGHIEFIQETQEFTKLVILLDLEEPYESFMIEYIYARQQELIGELKTIANKL
jgi:hypothetical protein